VPSDHNAFAVYGVLGVLRPFGKRLPRAWQHLLVWSGLRAAVAIALLLTLLGRGTEYETVSAIAYGVVLLSIVIQGATVGPLSRRLVPRPAV
jgi:CPA1 family monovalent cation:H+ antiporter